MAKVQEGDCCYICSRPLHGKGEMDHFPVPKSAGGKLMLPACINCHNDKDRVRIINWDASAAFATMAGLWSKADAGERLLLAKMFHVMSQAKVSHDKQKRAVRVSKK